MIPLWGVNITQNRKNEQTNGRELIVKTVKQTVDLEQVEDRAKVLEAKASLPKPWGIVKWVCGFIALIMAGGIIKGISEVGLEQAMQNAPILLVIFAVCTVVFVALKIWGNRRNNAVMQSDEVEQFNQDVQQTLSVAYGELGVPENAVKMDAFIFRYKEKNGKISIRSMGFFDFINVEVRAFVKDGQLCFADTESVYAMPLESLREIQTVKKTAMFHGWNKELSPLDKSFKPYHVAVNQYESIMCKPYYILKAEIRGEIWGVYFPGYELPVVEDLTGLRAQQAGK